MINGKKVLAIIPARGGSKGLPGKNIMELCGKPLIAWPLEAARESKYIDKCVVSTDDEEIARIALDWGGEVPSLRPKHLASDSAKSYDVVEYTLTETIQGVTYHYICLLEPTSPLTDSDDIDHAIKLLDQNRAKADSIVGVTRVEECHPIFNVRLNEAGLIQPFMGGEFTSVRRQDVEELFMKEGSLYISDVSVLLQKKSFYHSRTLPFIVPKWKSLEVDDYLDFKFVETVINNIVAIRNQAR
jgi:CMP-N,N'-diacetyllegionaminic acid synthase